MMRPSCFISYSHDSKEHKEWVKQLAEKLRQNEIDVHLDEWDVPLGGYITKYMETSVRESNFVLLICTVEFARKANAGRGGVGYESNIVTGEIFDGVGSPDKFVPLLRGDPKVAIPSYLRGKRYLDFRNDSEFDSKLRVLLEHIHPSSKYPTPSFESKHPPPSQRGQRSKLSQPVAHELFKQVYNFAYGMMDMNMERPEAEALAKWWVEKFADKDFELFKQVYNFAYSMMGMNKSRPEAEAFAKWWVEKFADKDFELFKEVYNFAYSMMGMNKSRPEAEAFALEQLSKSS